MSISKSSKVKGTFPTTAFMRYAAKAFDLIPLHMPFDKRTNKNGKVQELGKAPCHLDWTRRPYNSAKVREAAIESGRNIGVRLRANQLVIDVDPRNGGDTGFENLCAELGLDPDEWPRVITGSGGWHCYVQLPDGVLVRDTIDNDDFKGVEFKTKGRQVVAAGSLHPNGKYYRWSPDHPKIEDGLPMIPTTLLERIKRPARTEGAGGGQYDQVMIAELLSKLEPEDFRDQNKWFQLMQSCHHASNGDARHEFVEWSTQDEAYADHADIIGRRWDSLDPNRDDGVTHKTLDMHVRNAGHANALPARDVGDDFDDDAMAMFEEADDDMSFEGDDTADALTMFEGNDALTMFEGDDDGVVRENAGGWPDESVSKLEELNADYCGVFANGKYRIMNLQDDETGKRWSASNKQDFISAFEHRLIERDMTNVSRNAAPVISLGEAWQKWPLRNTAYSTCFDTNAAPGLIGGARLNLWTGFTMTPKKGDCEKFKAMIRDDLCAGNKELFEYVLNWTAFKLQNPGSLPGVGLVFVGNIGVGKTTFSDTVMNYFGNHGLPVDSLDAITGEFNGHLETVCLLTVNEAMWGGDKKRLGPMKRVVSDKHRDYHYKGVTRFRGVNRIGVIINSNEDWVIPAGKRERRYCVSRVAETHYAPTDAPADSPNRIYWNELYAELDGGGREAFLFEMLHRKLPSADWKPYGGDVPSTPAMAEQKFQGIEKIDKWYYERLRAGELPGGDESIIQPVGRELFASKWAVGGFSVHPTIVANDYRDWFGRINAHANVSDKMVLDVLRPYGWTGGEGHKVRGKRAWEVPSLIEARKRFAKEMNLPELFE